VNRVAVLLLALMLMANRYLQSGITQMPPAHRVGRSCTTIPVGSSPARPILITMPNMLTMLLSTAKCSPSAKCRSRIIAFEAVPPPSKPYRRLRSRIVAFGAVLSPSKPYRRLRRRIVAFKTGRTCKVMSRVSRDMGYNVSH
jgi:hypothetical protein